jgi:hypothetical protein
MKKKEIEKDSVGNAAEIPDNLRNAKAPYTRPVFTVYGSVSRLTTGGGGSLVDGNMTTRQGASDRRIKNNIVRIDTHHLGIGLYLFAYKEEYRDAWGRSRQFGVMADEVEWVMPQAVSLHPDGYKMVDYAMLGIGRNLQ